MDNTYVYLFFLYMLTLKKSNKQFSDLETESQIHNATVGKLLRETNNFYMYKIGNYGKLGPMTSRVFIQFPINHWIT